jgi:GcrA cell cycle regulator
MWTPERNNTLKLLWAAGQTASMIAVELGGVSRSAVLGRVHRLALPRRVKPHRHPKHKPAAKPRRQIERPPPPAPPPPVPAVSARPRKLLQLSAMQCRWPVTDEKPFLFCADRVEKPPYCPPHKRMASRD